jgi:cell division septation protein DedD
MRRVTTDSGRSLKPYLAIVTLLLVVGVVSYSLVDRWLAEPPSSEEDAEAPVSGGGRVVIGQSVPGASSRSPSPGSQPAESPFKPQEFTFYKSLGNAAQTPPALDPKPPAEPRVSAPPPPVTRVGSAKAARKSYTVQVGSFQDRKSAERLAAKVRHYRYTVSVTRVVLPDTGVRYRVRMGSFSTREDALKLADTLKKKDKKLEPFVALNLPASS